MVRLRGRLREFTAARDERRTEREISRLQKFRKRRLFEESGAKRRSFISEERRRISEARGPSKLKRLGGSIAKGAISTSKALERGQQVAGRFQIGGPVPAPRRMVRRRRKKVPKRRIRRRFRQRATQQGIVFVQQPTRRPRRRARPVSRRRRKARPQRREREAFPEFEFF